MIKDRFTGYASKSGFIIILVTVSLAVLILSASVIVTIGCSELMATRVRNDLLVSAYYVAISGAELMYSELKTRATMSWIPAPSISGTVAMGATTIGSYSTKAYKFSDQGGEGEFVIISVGTVNGRSATASVKYGFRNDESYTLHGPIPIGSRGAMTLTGASTQAKLVIDGPVMTNDSTVTQSGTVTIANGTIPSAAIPPVLYGYDAAGSAKFDIDGTRHADYFDVNNDGEYALDTNSDGIVTTAEAADQGKQTAFAADNVYNSSDGEISEKDVFYHYYTSQLNSPTFPFNRQQASLGIAPGGAHYYSGDHTFDRGDIATDVPIIFVDGNVTITYNDQEWNGSPTLAHTVVATGSVSINQPTNRPGDTLTIVAYGDVYQTGTMGNKGGTIGNLVICTSGNFTGENGGKMNASIFANGNLTINTIGDDQGKDHRVINLLTVQWDGPEQAPLGLPGSYPADRDLNTNFTIKNQSDYPPVWQRT